MRAVAGMLLAVALASGQVHKSPMAGQWFPADKEALDKLVDECFAAAQRRTGGAPPRKKLRALVVPHAALPYSGIVAASAYRQLGRAKNLIVLGFSHRRLVRGLVAPDVEAYEIAGGRIAVNRTAVGELGVRVLAEDQLCDHSLENQLPFVRRVADKAGFVPLYVGELSAGELASAAQLLAQRMEAGDVVIASCDFTHYGQAYGYTPWPNDKELPKQLFRRAMLTFELVGSLDVAAFDRFLETTGENLCGRGPVRLLMAALSRLKEDTYLVPVDYMTSGDLTRDYSLSVTYGALAFYPESAFAVGETDQKRLLASARQTLDRFLAGKKERVAPPEKTPELEQRTGVFVTIKKNGQLRGCVGTLFGSMPLYEAVADRTLAAASEDPRFRPVSAAEGPLSLEISLLTPLRRLTHWRQFRLGQGAVIVHNGRSGILLPQIAAENGWDAEQFLENLSRKAGLPPKAYQDPAATLYVYRAQVFSETEPTPASGDGRP
ncbi:MAG: AmmeMemoRadiSam system protein B [Bryobacterales bacterium]|nr:AmmeMemoRadiSam system protein B [Bryobacteraceae bacterium]MDW8353680.1 AmmeMemoRadiSam system protein B [Bryobacterales bacterium]